PGSEKPLRRRRRTPDGVDRQRARICPEFRLSIERPVNLGISGRRPGTRLPITPVKTLPARRVSVRLACRTLQARSAVRFDPGDTTKKVRQSTEASDPKAREK